MQFSKLACSSKSLKRACIEFRKLRLWWVAQEIIRSSPGTGGTLYFPFPIPIPILSPQSLDNFHHAWCLLRPGVKGFRPRERRGDSWLMTGAWAGARLGPTEKFVAEKSVLLIYSTHSCLSEILLYLSTSSQSRLMQIWFINHLIGLPGFYLTVTKHNTMTSLEVCDRL